ncbi:MAG: MoxR family ATPase [Ruminococcus sp.]|nr:MoxR family ATPase [Ruminococcus sp.]
MSDYQDAAGGVLLEVQKAIVGKADVTEKIMMAILAGGHVLVEDIPGMGKTTIALAFSKAMGLEENRVQFTPDVLPADLTGFTLYQKETGQFVYQPGALMCNFMMADEINRASPKTQSALLEVMEERQVTVDGVTRETGNPFIVIATENPVGSAGTQLLPESQLDRFMICVKMGYPSIKEEIEILKRSRQGRTTDSVEKVMTAQWLLRAQEEVREVYVHDMIYMYIAQLAKATREKEDIVMGLSPRGAVALTAMAKAGAYLKGRDYVVPDDVSDVFSCVAVHRIQLSAKARVGHVRTEDILEQILAEVKPPSVKRG